VQDLAEAHRRQIHIPGLSYFPVLIAVGLAIGAYGLVYHLALAALGAAIALVGIYGWSFEPAAEPSEAGPAAHPH
jgi:hypothetical protein